MLLMSIEAALARRDWLELMVGVAAVCVMAGSRGGGGGGWGMEAFGFRRPLGLSIMAWILRSADTHRHTQTPLHEDASTVFCLSCIEDLRTRVYTLGIQILCDSYQYVFRQGC